MGQDVWKEFEANPLTHSAAHYLMTIRDLVATHGYARVTDIARELNITRGSCSISLKPLKKRGLVLEDHNKFLRLSEEGEWLAQVVENNDKVLEEFLRDVLGVDGEQSEIDACKLEHLLSIETSLKLSGFMKFLNSNRDACDAFRKELKRFHPECPQDVKRCDICDGACLAHPESI